MSTFVLQLPNSFVDIDKEEMEYVDGGTWETFKNNILYLAEVSAPFRTALLMGGISMGKIANTAYMSLTAAIAMYSGVIGLSASTLGPIVGGIAGLTAAGIVIYLWNKDIT